MTFSNIGDPPRLPSFTVALALSRDLETERSNREVLVDPSQPLESLAAEAAMRFRETLAASLRFCHESGASADIMFTSLAHLAGHRDVLDAMLAELPHRIESDAVRREALRRFVRADDSITARLQTLDADAFDAALAEFLAPLLEVSPRDESIPRAWPRLFDIEESNLNTRSAVSIRQLQTDAPPATASELRLRIERAPLSDTMRQSWLAHADKIMHAESLPELHRQLPAVLALLALLPEAAEAFNDATWLDATTREARTAHFVLLIESSLEPSRTAADPLKVHRLHLALNSRITALHRLKVDVRPLVSLDATINQMLSETDQAATIAPQLSLLVRVLDRMLDSRDFKADAMRRSDLRLVYERLLRDTLKAEQQLVAVMPRLATDAAAPADAAIGTLLADHAQLVEDVKRVRDVDTWVDRIARINPRAETRFHSQVRKMCTWLADLNRRDDAVRAMTAFQRQIALFYPFPLEQKLADLDPDMIELTGGRQQDLRNLINSLRADWAEAWATGNASSEAGGRLLLLLRVMRAAEESFALQHKGASQLNDWGPWYLPPGSLDQPMRDLSGFVKLAIAAAGMNDWTEVRRHLNSLDESEAIVARLAGRQRLVLGSALAPRHNSIHRIVGKHLNRPAAESWWLEHRESLAHLCRHLAELQFARARGNRELVDQLMVWTNAIARDLWRELDDLPDMLPRIPGFTAE